MTALVEVGGMKLPVGVEFVKKDTWEVDSKTGKNKRKASVKKNELLERCSKNATANFILIMFWLTAVIQRQKYDLL
ncbi:hypothetical protein DMB65_02310 [Flavobacterium cheongpyeongense]|uniref:Uncharacterized protein n=1 Tax=Flavobacterium cheongpyeongense TaxID=2212651 RepID=A0A2V4BU39_9FLAO|nr:hypothetical protein [Flavobacterium cheongpyeongense]PXY42092.1 hypothetical protein DMB65_02310 [Flavobacterium cheongpyeongense]